MTVETETTSRIAFDIACVATTGALRVVTVTAGRNLDANGYTLILDGAPGHTVGVNSTLLIPRLAPGLHPLVVDGLAANCAVEEVSPEVLIVAGVETTVTITVRCTGPLRDAIVLIVSVTGTAVNPLFSIQTDGSDLMQVTNNHEPYYWPAVSPDGMEIAATRGAAGQGGVSIVVFRNDGEQMREIVAPGPFPIDLVWGPNGRIFFAQPPTENQWPDLCSVNVDGTDRVCVKPEDGRLFFGDFALSPDGGRVVYSAAGQFIWMDTDGTNLESIQFERGTSHQPDWSPDGARIVYQHIEDVDGDGVDDAHLYLMNADGTNQTRLSTEPLYHGFPRWSPDGRHLLYLTWPASGATEPKVMDIENRTVRKLLPEGMWGGPGTWSPLP